ncbi:MAG: hypothetical protein ACRDVE_18980 [Actinocrinis sp.]
MAYFAALLTRSVDRWTARDADLDEIDDVAGLVEFMREVPEERDQDEDEPDTAVLFLEQEDVWFAVVRLDAEEDPRLFVSDMAAVSRSAYGDLLLAGDLGPLAPDGSPAAPDPSDPDGDGSADADPAPDGASAAEDDDEAAPPAVVRPTLTGLTGLDDESGRRPVHNGPAGDAELLADFGVRPSNLVGLCGKTTVPADALAGLAEALGAADELEEVR